MDPRSDLFSIGFYSLRHLRWLESLPRKLCRAGIFEWPAVRGSAGVIKQDIQEMNAAIVELQTVSSSDHERNRQSQDHSVVVVSCRLTSALGWVKGGLPLRWQACRRPCGWAQEGGLPSAVPSAQSALPGRWRGA